jgi:hypothetical protein
MSIARGPRSGATQAGGRRSGAGAPGPETLRLKVELPESTADSPILYANNFVVNFTGVEFYVNVVAAVPEPWQSGQMPSEIKARVLGRYAVPIHYWIDAVKSMAKQINSLEAQGAFKIPITGEGISRSGGEE